MKRLIGLQKTAVINFKNIITKMETQNLTEIDLSILKYYKQGRELSGFEGVHNNLCNMGFLDSDLELTSDARKYMRENEALFENVIPYNNKMYISIE